MGTAEPGLSLWEGPRAQSLTPVADPQGAPLGPGDVGRGGAGRGRAYIGAYVGAPLVYHVQVYIVERVDLGHGLVRRRVQRNQH